MKMPHGLLMWPHSFKASTVQPMENMIIASMMVSTVLSTTPRTALKLLGGTKQPSRSAPEQIVATASQPSGTAYVAIVVNAMGEEEDNQRRAEESFLRVHKIPQDDSSFSFSDIQEDVGDSERKRPAHCSLCPRCHSHINTGRKKNQKLTNTCVLWGQCSEAHAYKKNHSQMCSVIGPQLQIFIALWPVKTLLDCYAVQHHQPFNASKEGRCFGHTLCAKVLCTEPIKITHLDILLSILCNQAPQWITK